MTLRIHMSIHNDDLHKTTAKRNTAGGVTGLESDNLVDNIYLPFNSLTIAEFQTNPATGTATNPDHINDNLSWFGASWAVFDAVNEYCEVTFNHPEFIRQYRHRECNTHAGDGQWKIQYFWDNTWIDLITFNTLNHNGNWTAWKSLNQTILTKKIRIIATILDSTHNKNYIVELEMKG